MADNENFFSDGSGSSGTGGQDDSNLDDFFQPAAKPAAPKPAPKAKAATPPPQKAPPAPKMTPPPPPAPSLDSPFGAMDSELFPAQKVAQPPPPIQPPPAAPQFGGLDQELFPVQKGKTPPPPPAPPIFNQISTPPPMQEMVQEDFPTPSEPPQGMVAAPDSDDKKKKIKLVAMIAGAVIGFALIFGGGGYMVYKMVGGKAKKPKVAVKTTKPTKPVETPGTESPTATSQPATPPPAAPAASSKGTKTPTKGKKPVATSPAPTAAPVAATPAPAAKPTQPTTPKQPSTPAIKPAQPAPSAAPAPAAKSTTPAPSPAAKPATPPAPAPAAAKVAPFTPPALPELPPVKNPASGMWTVLLERVALTETLAADGEKVRKAGVQPYRYSEARVTSFVKFTVVVSFGSVAEANDAAKKIQGMGFRPTVEVSGAGAILTVAATLSEDDANAIVSKVQGQGIKGARIEKKPTSAKLQVLAAGPYGSEAEANDAASKLRSAGFPDAILKRVK